MRTIILDQKGWATRLMRQSVLSVAFIIGMMAASMGQETSDAGPWADSLLPILEVLDQAKVSGSLMVSGRCVEGYTPDLPQFRVPSKTGNSPVHALREVLADDPAIEVTQSGPKSIIRMSERGVPTDILDVRISHLAFNQWYIYNPDDALNVILRAPEVIAFMKARDIERPGHGSPAPGNPTGRWPSERPRISATLDNVTVKEALDTVLQTFPSIWIL